METGFLLQELMHRCGGFPVPLSFQLVAVLLMSDFQLRDLVLKHMDIGPVHGLLVRELIFKIISLLSHCRVEQVLGGRLPVFLKLLDVVLVLVGLGHELLLQNVVLLGDLIEVDLELSVAQVQLVQPCLQLFQIRDRAVVLRLELFQAIDLALQRMVLLLKLGLLESMLALEDIECLGHCLLDLDVAALLDDGFFFLDQRVVV